jgi:hypothetical protein
MGEEWDGMIVLIILFCFLMKLGRIKILYPFQNVEKEGIAPVLWINHNSNQLI